MEYGYSYQARTARGKIIEGVVFSRNRSLAFGKLKRNGFTPVSVNFSLAYTVKNFISSDFNPEDLSRFYSTMGRRLKNGRSFIEGLDAAMEFTADQRLRQSIMVMRQASQDGQSEKEAMLTAELPSRDAMVISASATTGNTGDAFQALSKEIAQATSLRRSVKAVFRMPMIMSLLMYAFFYGALVFVAPATMKFLKNLNMSLNLSFFNREYFAFAEVFNDNRTIGTLLYASVPVLFFFFLRSRGFARMRDRIRRLKTISEKADHAILWNSYALLYDAATSAREACQILSRAANRDDSRQAFLKLGRLMESGRSLEDSVAPAGFPHFVVTGVKSATTGGNLVEGVADMVKNLDEDVLALTEALKENVKIFAVLVMGLGLAGIFMVTYYPLVSTVLSAL